MTFHYKINMKTKLAFSLFEISIVLLVVSILLIGITKGKQVLTKFDVLNAAKLTKSSVVGKIDGLSLWLETTSSDSIDHIEASDGHAVSVWNDISDSSFLPKNSEQTNSASQPKYITNVINGLPVLRFDGSNDFMTLPPASTIGLSNSNYEIFVVYQTKSTSVQFLLAGAIEQYEVHLNGAANLRFIPTNGKYSDIDFSNSLSLPHIGVVRVQNGFGIVRVDGVDTLDVETNAISTSTTTLVIGTRSVAGALPMNGDIAEIIIFTRALSDQERSDVESYLSEKWNIELNA